MGLRTVEQYYDSIREQKPEVYMLGKKIESVADNKDLQIQLSSMTVLFAAAQDPKYRDRAVLKSPLINEDINLWTHLPQSEKEWLQRLRLHRELAGKNVCLARCMFADVSVALQVATYEIDKAHGTKYHQNFKNFVKRVQKEDLMVTGAVMDVRGDRNFGPKDQEDKDLYVHVVEKRADGIIVRGAKGNNTAVIACNQLLVMPCRQMVPGEEEFAVAFVTPVDTKGIKYILRPTPSPREKKELDHPISRKVGMVESLTIFEDVFVPWENVFMCGEIKYTGLMVGTFASTHRWSKCACAAAHMDMFVGAGALIAEMNGVEKAPHIRQMLTDMIMYGEVGYHAALAAAVEGKYHASGIHVPNFLCTNVGKYLSCHPVGEQYVMLQDIGGGITVTVPTEKDWNNPVTRKYMEKYLKGRKGVPTEHRLRAIKLIEDLTASEYAGWYMGMCINAAGSPQAEFIEILRQYDLKKAVELGKHWAGIK